MAKTKRQRGSTSGAPPGPSSHTGPRGPKGPRGVRREAQQPLKAFSAEDVLRALDRPKNSKSMQFNHSTQKWQLCKMVEYDDCKKAKDSYQVFVRNLSPETTRLSIRKVFASFGEIKEVNIGDKKKRKGLKNLGFCFVVFNEESGFKNALEAASVELDGVEVSICETMSQNKQQHQIQIAGISSYYSNRDVRGYFSRFGRVVNVLTVQRVCSRLVAFDTAEAVERVCAQPRHAINQVPLTIRKVDYKMVEEEEKIAEENRLKQQDEEQKEEERKQREKLADLKRQQEHPLLVRKERRKNRRNERRIKRIERSREKAASERNATAQA